jgi:hypothetical protein
MEVKTFEVKPGAPESLLGALEADIAARIQTLFRRCPTLCGFSVQDSLPKDIDQSPIPDAELFVTEIDTFPRLDNDQHGEIYDEIVLVISALLYEQPHACDYLRGRTFARTIH